VGEDREEKDSETAEVDQCWSVVASMGQRCSVVGARVEQGRQCGLFGCIGRRRCPRALAATISERGRVTFLASRTCIQADHVMCRT
jgi:hypothetical protein